MSTEFNYKHLYYFWVVAKEGGIARAAERLELAVPTVSIQVRALERALGVALLKTQGRNVVLTEAGMAAMREADHIFALGEELPHRVREAVSGKMLRFGVGISDGISKAAVHRVLAPVLEVPHLRLQCHEGEFEQLLGELAMHKLDALLSDRAAVPQRELRITSRLLLKSPMAWYAAPKWAAIAHEGYPRSLARVPMILPTRHSAVRARIDHWLEHERIVPNVVGEFEDSALLTTFGAAGMGVFPAPEFLASELGAASRLQQFASFPDVVEQFHLIYTARKVLHPLLLQLLQGATVAPAEMRRAR